MKARTAESPTISGVQGAGCIATPASRWPELLESCKPSGECDMDDPRCDRCASRPVMRPASTEKLIDFGVSTRGVPHLQRRMGHPAQAMAWTLMNAASAVGNYFFETVVYKCEECGHTVKRMRQR